MSDKLSRLPLELVLHILSYLPFEALLSFGVTSRSNYHSHILCLKRLRLGVFERRVHSMISCLQAGWATTDQVGSYLDEDASRDYFVSVIQPRMQPTIPPLTGQTTPVALSKDTRRRIPTTAVPARARTHEQMIHIQNRIFARVVNRYGSSLVKLEFMAYDLDNEGARVLGAQCTYSLRHLALRFEHPHIRNGNMRPSTWLHPAPSSPAWNLLLGIGREPHLGVFGLETLVLERAGITPWQLTMLVRRNPRLRVLKLRTCLGAQPEFLDWLGGVERTSEKEGDAPVPGERLETLWLEHCHRLLSKPVGEFELLPDEACDAGLEWVRGLKNLKSLSFSECLNIPTEYVERANKLIWNIPEVIPPYSLEVTSSFIEVDPQLR
ncbi:F-box domain protein [Aspergillus terreus]|uniref:F-box domain protein n=1 Tax=Aspergillus terreus TaxID=33178 RepID=A0A5M3YUV3_ASPTE|nr:hypothetical protein ATETN484_0002084700 [Aspergillus terreus]GFF15703.1 F-box domain protein [Aspergillus terreus]